MKNTLTNIIEDLRIELHASIEKHEQIEKNEVSHEETIRISQELDKYLNIYIKSEQVGRGIK